MSEKLLIGWGEVDVTPSENGKKIPLYGQYYPRLAEKIHSRLKVTVCAMSSGSEHFITGSIDGVGCPVQVTERIRQEVGAIEKEIDPSKIFLNAIHSHSAPSLGFQKNPSPGTGIASRKWFDLRDVAITPEEYADFAIPLIVNAIVNAWRSRRPGGIASGFGNARVGHCRRAVYANGTAEMYGDTTRPDFIGMETSEDTGVEMLFTLDEQGKRTGLFLNVACPSQNMESTYMVSSDFAGATRERLKEAYGEDFRMIYQISPAGCQSPRDLVRHYTTEPDFWHADGVVVLAERLFNAVQTAVVGEADYTPVLKSTSFEVALPRRRVSYTDWKNAKAEVERLCAIMPEDEAYKAFCDELHAKEKLDGPGPYDSKLHHFVLIQNAKAVIARYENQDASPELFFDMNVVRLGNIAIASNPFELYLVYGQNIKARSHAFQTFLVQLSNGAKNFHAGYLPSPEAERYGGYGGLVINGQVGSDGGYKLADITVEAINKLFD